MTKPFVLYHGRAYHLCGYQAVTLSVNGKRHEYILTTMQADTVEHLCRKVSALKALNFAKSRARSITALTAAEPT